MFSRLTLKKLGTRIARIHDVYNNIIVNCLTLARDHGCIYETLYEILYYHISTALLVYVQPGNKDSYNTQHVLLLLANCLTLARDIVIILFFSHLYLVHVGVRLTFRKTEAAPGNQQAQSGIGDGESGTGNGEPTMAKMSNDDFRQLLSKN